MRRVLLSRLKVKLNGKSPEISFKRRTLLWKYTTMSTIFNTCLFRMELYRVGKWLKVEQVSGRLLQKGIGDPDLNVERVE